MQLENTDPLTDFYHKHRKPPAKGLSVLVRRLSQFFDLFSSRFNSREGMLVRMSERYSTSEEIEFYKVWNSVGLLDFEREAIDMAGACQSILVVGAGAGRECFALKGKFKKIVGVDTNKKMIEAARALSSGGDIDFFESLDEIIDQKFDIIFVTPSLNSHNPGSKFRVEFLKTLKKFSHLETKLLYYAEVVSFDWSSRYLWSSVLFRARLLFSSYHWEKGDLVKSYLGYHNTSTKLVYYHFYPSSEAVISELADGGWTVLEETAAGFFINEVLKMLSLFQNKKIISGDLRLTKT